MSVVESEVGGGGVVLVELAPDRPAEGRVGYAVGASAMAYGLLEAVKVIELESERLAVVEGESATETESVEDMGPTDVGDGRS